MNRLDFLIRRLTAQRACLQLAAELISEIEGPVLEVGLGKGRTYDFLRELFPAREIFAFDRNVGSYPDATPDLDHIILGDFRETLMSAQERIGASAALVHCDFGSENREEDTVLARWLGPAIDRLLGPNGVVAADREMTVSRWTPVSLPSTVDEDAYYLYRAGTGSAP
tara:strand:+ start:32457 stop:32960 length:504 start_codon:yes stop_codon:yes gene_type:complete